MKVKNITPEEKENALALIRKCGLEETEENINYYVRMQRDSKKHRRKKEGLTENNSSSSLGKIFGWGIIIALFFMIKMCGGCNGCDSSSSTSDDDTTPRKCLDCGKDISDLHPSFKRCLECDSHKRALDQLNENLKKANSPYADYSR